MSFVASLDQATRGALGVGGESSLRDLLGAVQSLLVTAHQTSDDVHIDTLTRHLQCGVAAGGDSSSPKDASEQVLEMEMHARCQIISLPLFPAPSLATLHRCFGKSPTAAQEHIQAPLTMLPTGTLVSFVGMVQDVSDSALLAASNCNSFFESWIGGDAAIAEYNQSPLLNVHQCYVIPIPGSLYGIPDEESVTATTHPEKVGNRGSVRSREVDVRDESNCRVGGRRLELQSSEAEFEEEELVIEGDDVGRSPRRISAPRPIPSDHNHIADGGGGLLNLPTAPPTPSLSLGAILTLITAPMVGDAHSDDVSMESHPIKPNSIVECYGLIMNASTENDSEHEDDEFSPQARYERIPVSCARRVLCLGCRVVDDAVRFVARPFRFGRGVSSNFSNAWDVFGPRALEAGRRQALRQQLFGTFIPRARSLLLSYLKGAVCGGDGLAAEYLLLHLCSTVDSRHNGSTVSVGDVPLRILLPVKGNITGAARDNEAIKIGGHLAGKLRHILTCGSSLVNVTRGVVAFCREDEEESSKRRISPKAPSLMPNKDAGGCYIAAAPFQVPNGHVTVMAVAAQSCEGTSSSVGGLSSAVQEEAYMFIHRQCVTIDYFFNKVELITDIRALVVQPLMDALENEGATDRSHTSPPLRLACSIVLSPSPSTPASAAFPEPQIFSGLQSHTHQAEDGNEHSEGAFVNTSRENRMPWGAEEAAACRLYLDVVRRCASIDLETVQQCLLEGGTPPLTNPNTFDSHSRSLEQHSQRLNDELVAWQATRRKAFNSDSLIHNNTLSVVLSMCRALARSHGRLPLGSVRISASHDHNLLCTGVGGWITTPEESLSDFQMVQQLEGERFERNERFGYVPSDGCA